MATLIQFPLDLPEVEVLKTELSAEGHLIVTVESTRSGTTCRRCGKAIEHFHGYDKPLRLRHLSVLEHRVYLQIRPKRYRCPHGEGRPTTTQRCVWYEPNSPHTRAFEQSLLRALINSTISDVGRKHGVGEEAMEGIIERHLAQEVDWSQFESLVVVGLDEIALRKGHRDFVAIVTARDHRDQLVLLAVLPDRLKETVQAFLASIPERLKVTIKQVCTDMYEGFVKAAEEELPEAEVVVDRFHVAKTYRENVDRLRRQEVKRLKETLSEAEYKADVKGTLWLFRKNWTDLSQTGQAQLERLFAHSPLLGVAHLMREILTVIFNTATSKAQATAWLQAWRDFVKGYQISGFERFLTTLDNWMDKITNYFLDRRNSGFVEGFNNKIKVLKRRCYGLLNVTPLFQRLQLDLEGYRRFGHA